jgi:hypothetical protein
VEAYRREQSVKDRWNLNGHADRGTLMQIAQRIMAQRGRKIVIIETIEDTDLPEVVEAVA